jgi:hypothetical protein
MFKYTLSSITQFPLYLNTHTERRRLWFLKTDFYNCICIFNNSDIGIYSCVDKNFSMISGLADLIYIRGKSSGLL